MDFVGSWAKDAANMGTFTGTCTQQTKGPLIGQAICTSGIPTGYNNTDLQFPYGAANVGGFRDHGDDEEGTGSKD